MSHTWLDRAHFPLPHSTPSLLDPPDRTNPCVQLQGLMLGRFAEKSPLTLNTVTSCEQKKNCFVKLLAFRSSVAPDPSTLCLEPRQFHVHLSPLVQRQTW